MPVPPPFSDPSHVLARVLVLSAILEKAVAETEKIMEEIRNPDGFGAAPAPGPAIEPAPEPAPEPGSDRDE